MNSKTLRLATGFVAASSLWISSLPAFGFDVYRNTTTRLDKYWAPGEAEFGDEIILTQFGAANPLVNFTFEYFGAGLSGNETVTLRFYRNNGTQVISGANRPNAVLYDSGAFNLAALAGAGPNGNTPPDGRTLSFALPNVVVPDGNFTWTVQFEGLAFGEIAGLDIYDPPTVGNNYDDYWEFNSVALDWELKRSSDGTPMSFGALAEAVPEASPLQLGLLAAALWVGWSIYRRRTVSA